MSDIGNDRKNTDEQAAHRLHHIDRRERFAEQTRVELEKQAFRKTDFGVRKKPPGRLARLKRLLRK